ncbi:type VII secretion target [Nocardia arizonensis]|uniref:type VII secretion target n=1 Tax=Nocardia arizonensis TaxID=1141647 RepID=UPI0006D15B4E|nr:type VII secretion target [Nocardia arizonensis]
MRTDVTALNRAVEEGQLWIDGVLVADGAHERCAQRYEQLADEVEAQIQALRSATSVPGFGGFASGAALRGGFEAKAEDAVTRMRSYADAARALAQTFRAAAAAYTRSDEEFAGAVGRITGGEHA